MANQTPDLPPICDYTDSDYQASFWEAGDRAYEDRVEAIALSRLLPASGKILLEVGAGAGRNTPRYQGFERIVLVDYSLTQLEQAQERLGRTARYLYIAADAYRLPFVPGLFDAATMIRTLHHMAEPQRALAQVRMVLRPQGIFILEYANKRNLKAIVRYLSRRQSWNPFSQQPVEFAALNFDFHPRAIHQWLEAENFMVQRQLTVSHFRLGAIKHRISTDILVKMDSLAQLTGNWWQLSPSVFLRALAVGDTAQVIPGTFFRCPACEFSPLEESVENVVCPSCQRQWEIINGIYDFRVR
jgi:ubiquinone/menaquinone biosynthesis C-methylase UbiE